MMWTVNDLTWKIKYMTIEEMDHVLDLLKTKRDELLLSGFSTLHQRDRAIQARRSKAAKKSREALQYKGEQLAEQVRVGDIVRVVGVRNTKYNYRLVTSITETSISGWQMGRTRTGTWFAGPEHTTMQTKNIREVFKDHGYE